MDIEAESEAQSQEARDVAVRAAFGAFRDDRTMPGEEGKPARPKPYAEIVPLWEAMWQTFDFSWGGLADAGWERGTGANDAQKLKRWRAPADFPGGGAVQGEGATVWKQANLQDYWRWSIGITEEAWPGRLLSDEELRAQGLLREVDGRLFHLIHCADADIYQAFGRNSTLARLVRARLEAASGWNGDDATDGRVQLKGARDSGVDPAWLDFTDAGEDRKLHLDASLAALEGICAEKMTFGEQVSFIGATFGERARFTGATFGERAGFHHATFGERAGFGGATFGKAAGFVGATFGELAGFHHANFGHGVRFSHATFGEGAEFDGATFGKGAWFTGARFGERAWFVGARFGEGARFGDARFGEGAWFTGAQFGEGARFGGAQFGERASFVRAQFGERASFGGAQFGEISWARAVFAGTSDFSDVNWRADHHYGGAFSGARFEDVADFRTENFSAFAALHDATFKQRLLLLPPSDGKRPEDMFAAARAAAKAAVAAEQKGLERKESESAGAFRRRREQVRSRIWSELAGGYRTAKIAMEAAGDFEREQTFYRFEVKARMRKTHESWILRRPGLSGWERFASFFYRVFSDYGASIGRPFAGLILFVVSFAGLYYAIAWNQFEEVTPRFAAPVEISWSGSALPELRNWTGLSVDAIQALEFSLNNAFRPLSALATQEPVEGAAIPVPEKRLGEKLLFEAGTGWGLIVRIFAIIQSLLSFVLAFLFGLAVRRKFQIS